MKKIIIVLFIITGWLECWSQKQISSFLIFDSLGVHFCYFRKAIQLPDTNFLTVSENWITGQSTGIYSTFLEYSKSGHFVKTLKYPPSEEIRPLDLEYILNRYIYLYAMNMAGNGPYFSYLVDSNGSVIWKKDYQLNQPIMKYTYDSCFVSEDNNLFVKYNFKGDTIKVIPFIKILDSIELKLFFISDIYVDTNQYLFIANGSDTTSNRLITISKDFNQIKKDTINKLKNIYKFFKLDDGYFFASTVNKLTKTDKYFNIIWQKNFDSNYGIPFFIKDKFDNIYLLLSHKSSSYDSIYNIKKILIISSNGDVKKEINFYMDHIGHQGYTYDVTSFDLTLDHGLLIAGYSYSLAGNINGFLMKIDTNFNNDTNISNMRSLSIKSYENKIQGISVYPNPLNSNCTIILPFMNESKYLFSLYSITGSIVRQEIFNSSTYQFNRENLQGGMYIYSIVSVKGCYIGKLIINP